LRRRRNDDVGERGGTGALFRNGTMDFLAGWLLGYAQQGGMSPGTLLHCYSLIRDGDPESWTSTFLRAGEDAVERAEDAAGAGRDHEAAEAWGAAQIAFRAVLAMTDPRSRQAATATAQMTSAFESMLAVSQTSLEPWEIDFHDTYLPAYVSVGFERSPRLLMIVGGGDTYVEDLWFFGARAAIQRGWSVLMVDLPGQGDTPSRGLHFGQQTMDGFRQVVDAAHHRGFAGELMLMGWSGGGIFTTRFASIATDDDRVGALVASTPVYDPATFFRRAIPRVLQRDPDSALTRTILSLARRNRVLRHALARYDWQFGPGGIAAVVDKFEGLGTELADLRAPVLALAGLAEASESLRQANSVIEHVRERHPASELVSFDAWSGGAAHCQVGNLPPALDRALDWLESLHRSSTGSSSRK
jgi:pimeloyl-ACP methyl ester carboxylesterase